MEHLNPHNPELLLLISNSSQPAFNHLIDLYWKKIYGHALAYTKSATTAEELTQDVFMDIWNNRHKLPSIENFENYLFIITRNRILKLLRKKLEQYTDIKDVQLEEDLWLPQQQLEYREIHEAILKKISELPPVRQKVFTMSRLEGLSYEEISARLNISRNTVKEHIVKALGTIRQYLAEQEGWMMILLLYLPELARAIYF